MNQFPDEPRAKNYRTKERTVKNFITETFSDHLSQMLFDKGLGACSKRRPDILMEFEEYVIIVEIDEHQHKRGYEIICEHKRLMEISQDLAHRPLVVIRFNPDSYKVGSTRHPSCFSPKTGLLLKEKMKEWEKRLATLKETVQRHIDQVPDKTITQEFLFFDEKSFEAECPE